MWTWHKKPNAAKYFLWSVTYMSNCTINSFIIIKIISIYVSSISWNPRRNKILIKTKKTKAIKEMYFLKNNHDQSCYYLSTSISNIHEIDRLECDQVSNTVHPLPWSTSEFACYGLCPHWHPFLSEVMPHAQHTAYTPKNIQTVQVSCYSRRVVHSTLSWPTVRYVLSVCHTCGLLSEPDDASKAFYLHERNGLTLATTSNTRTIILEVLWKLFYRWYWLKNIKSIDFQQMTSISELILTILVVTSQSERQHKLLKSATNSILYILISK